MAIALGFSAKLDAKLAGNFRTYVCKLQIVIHLTNKAQGHGVC